MCQELRIEIQKADALKLSRKKRATQSSSQKWVEKMEDVLHKLRSDVNSGTPVIVEGQKDVSALRALGIHGSIHCIHNRGYRLFEVAEQLAHYKRIILLTDFDDQGKKLSKIIRRHLETNRCKVDVTYWNKMKNIFRRIAKDIEGLTTITSKLQLPCLYNRCQD